jgi:integrase
MRGAWNRIAKRAKLAGVTPHTLRHSFASVAGDEGYADTTIATLLGHSSGSVTSRYIHRLDSVLIAAANKVSDRVHSLMTAA